MEEKRNDVGKRIRRLEVTSVDQLSSEAAACHLRPFEGRRKKDRCDLCSVHDDVEDYESLLFRMDDRRTRDSEEYSVESPEDADAPAALEALRRGTWADSEAEKIVKILVQFSRKNHAPPLVQDGGSAQVRLYESYKKEFKLLRILWRQLNDQASAIDELSMASLRLRLRLAHEVPGFSLAVFICTNRDD